MKHSYGKIEAAGGDTGQPLAMAKRLSLIAQHLEPGAQRFLDCGCGAGDYVRTLRADYRLDARGIEYDKTKVAKAQEDSELESRVTQGDLENLDLPDAFWDYAMLNEVLEHVPNESTALREVHRILKPGGTLFVFSPNRWFPFETHGVNWKGTQRRVPHWIPLIPYLPISFGSHFFDYWARNYWHRELAGLLTEAGFTISETAFIWQTFEGISGRQPRVLKAVKPILRSVADTLERLPGIRRFGVSQAIVCRKVH